MANFTKSKESVVSIQKSSYQDINIDTLLKPFGGIKKIVNKGEQVLLKTNLLNATEPDRAVITHPDVLKSVAISIQKAGANPIIGDSPSGPFSQRRLTKVYKRSGLIDLSKELGVELNYNTKHKKVENPNGKKLQNLSICDFVTNADKIISLPKIKTHSLMMMTLATKIMFGVVPGLTKIRYHSKFIRKKDFADMLLDVLSISTPDLVIMDGIIGMQGDGPTGGEPVNLGVMLASVDSVAIDLAVCKMLNIEPTGIPTLKQAKIRNLWPEKTKYPLLSPDDVRYDGFILPSTAGYLLTGKKQPKKIPVILDNCKACGQCVEICPKNTIRMIDNKASIDYSKCIKCYCCHEVCTYDAIKIENLKK